MHVPIMIPVSKTIHLLAGPRDEMVGDSFVPQLHPRNFLLSLPAIKKMSIMKSNGNSDPANHLGRED